MSLLRFHRRFRPVLMACAAVAALGATGARAQAVDPNKLLEIMVAKGLVSRAEADAMIAEARVKPAPAAPAYRGGVAADGSQVIPYVPQVVRDQITEQVKAQLASQAQTEGWAKPGETPEWTRRINFYGDVRVRGEGRFYEAPTYNDAGEQIGGNYPSFVDWDAVNRGAGLDANPASPGFVKPPYLNTVEDRRRFRLRARLGMHAVVNDLISADIRVATGADHSPVSTNQTLGQDGTGTYQIWLDRGYLRLTPAAGVQLDIGRFGNPFWSSDILFDNDMNFDGIAVSGGGNLTQQVSLFGTAGAFPVFNTSFNFGSRDAGPFRSKDRYMFAAQAGVEYRPIEGMRARFAGSYFDYYNIQGQFSAPCAAGQDVCDTDETRPAFQQFGNTMVPLRNVVADPGAAPGRSPEVQYFGLASDFRILNLRGQLEYDVNDRVGVRLEGDFVRNLAFDRAAAGIAAQNNFAPTTIVNGVTSGGQYAGGRGGWQGRLLVGSLDMGFGQSDWSAERGDWSLHLGYRRLASDAVLDAFADSDFGMGGTNVKGWMAGGNYALARNSYLGVRWMSTDEVSGPPLAVDRLFVEINSRF